MLNNNVTFSILSTLNGFRDFFFNEEDKDILVEYINADGSKGCLKVPNLSMMKKDTINKFIKSMDGIDINNVRLISEEKVNKRY